MFDGRRQGRPPERWTTLPSVPKSSFARKAEFLVCEEDGVVVVGWRESDMDTTLIVLALAALIYWWGLL